MPNEAHRHAEALAGSAESAMRSGDVNAARLLYSQAATLEAMAVASFAGTSKARTFSILAVSHASLLYKARELEAAEHAIYKHLSTPAINDRGRSQLRELLEVVWDEQVIARQGLAYSGEELWFALRGGDVGSGTAPVDVAIHYMNAANQLVYRSVEWTAKFPMRRGGVPPREVASALQARATQPTAGSYRFSVRLLQPEQMDLFPEGRPESRINPAAVTDFVVDFVKTAAEARSETIAKVVPDMQYRRALLQLVRNMVPFEKALGEVEIRRVSSGRTQSALLVHPSRENINAALRVSTPRTPGLPTDTPKQPLDDITGTLRALHLDKHWLEIVPTSGVSQRCETREDVLDDVVGPMVNKRVRAIGYWRSRAVGPLRFDLEDIDLA